jgi:uncharacterized linocin/CFP29 family protein
VAETADHGYPVREHVARVLGEGSEIIWAPAIEGALLLSARGGDFELHLGQDVSIGYLSHDASSVELYFEESLTFLVQTPGSGVSLGLTGPAGFDDARRAALRFRAPARRRVSIFMSLVR